MLHMAARFGAIDNMKMLVDDYGYSVDARDEVNEYLCECVYICECMYVFIYIFGFYTTLSLYSYRW